MLAEQDHGERRTFKLIVIGDPGVGKTSLIRAQAGMLFRPEYIATIGADVITRIYEFNKQSIYLLIFDIAGESLYDSINDYFFSGASSALIVFDLTRRETFSRVEEWSNEIRKRIPFKIPMTLLANKSDLQKQRKVKPEEEQEVARRMGVDNYLETSAMTSENVGRAFIEILARCLIEPSGSSKSARNLEDILRKIHPADQELVAEIKKLDDIGRRGLGSAGKD